MLFFVCHTRNLFDISSMLGLLLFVSFGIISYVSRLSSSSSLKQHGPETSNIMLTGYPRGERGGEGGGGGQGGEERGGGEGGKEERGGAWTLLVGDILLPDSGDLQLFPML